MENKNKDKKVNSETIDQKRRAVHKIVTGTTLVTGASLLTPTSWKKPVIESVIVPAHAQTSVTTTAEATTTMETTTTTQCPEGYIFNPYTQECIFDDASQ